MARGRLNTDPDAQAAFVEGFTEGRPPGEGPLGRSTKPSPPPALEDNAPLALGAGVSPDVDGEVVDAEIVD